MSLENLYQLSDTLMNFTKKMLKNIWAGTLISLGFYIKIIIIYYKGRFYDIPCSWFLSRNVLLKIFIWFYTTKKKNWSMPSLRIIHTQTYMHTAFSRKHKCIRLQSIYRSISHVAYTIIHTSNIIYAFLHIKIDSFHHFHYQ